ncbi:hypothetical protein EYF80_050957 [Liparis tanakae]|uniref:Uncharacterized protein n=1 Tax=Liparis tanakae TaxID=230148 RepID=A0A4Z2FEM7_9TELE|nr:hypothetical protein EYF80_050957 [Liparis tanakae]
MYSVLSSGSSPSFPATLPLRSSLLPLNGLPSLVDSVWRTDVSSGVEPARLMRPPPPREVDVVRLSELVASNSLPMKLRPAWRMCELPANT